MRTTAFLEGRAAVVTGASGGIGAAIAIALAACGARLYAVGRDEHRVRATVDEIRRQGGTAESATADISCSRQLEELVAQIRRDLGRLDILVHAAGLYRRAVMAQARVEDLDDHYLTNVRAPYQLTQAMLPMLARGGGDVVFINSTQGLSAGAGLGQYAAANHAVKAFADSLRAEVNSASVRISTVHLGRTATPLQEAIFALEGRPYRPERLIQPEDVAQLVVAVIALPGRAQVTSITLLPTEKT